MRFDITRLPTTSEAWKPFITEATDLAGSADGGDLVAELAGGDAGLGLAGELAGGDAGLALAGALADSGAGRDLAEALAGNAAGVALAEALAGSGAGVDLAGVLTGVGLAVALAGSGLSLAAVLAGSDPGKGLALELAGSAAGRDLAVALAGNDGGVELVAALDGSEAGRALALELAGSAAGLSLAGELAGSAAGLSLAVELAGSAAGLSLAGVLAGGGAGRDLAGVLAGGGAGRDLAGVLAGSGAGRDLAGVLAGSAAGRDLAGVLAGSAAGQALAVVLADSGASPGLIGAVVLLIVLVPVLALWLATAGVVAAEVVFVAGVATRVDDDDEPSGDKVADVLEAGDVDGLSFDPNDLDPAAVLAIRGVLENLVGVTTELILTGKFADDPAIEDRITRDRDFLRSELFENPDGIDGAMIAPLAQRTIATIIPVLDDGPMKELLRSIGGAPDANPRSPEAAENAVKKAEEVAANIDPESEHLPEDTTPAELVAGGLGWVKPTAELLGPASAVTTILLALGAGGPIAVAIGAVLGLLYLYRPNKKQ